MKVLTIYELFCEMQDAHIEHQKELLSNCVERIDVTWFFYKIYSGNLDFEIDEIENQDTNVSSFGTIGMNIFSNNSFLYSGDSYGDLNGSLYTNYSTMKRIISAMETENKKELLNILGNMADSKEQEFLKNFLNGHKFENVVNEFTVKSILNI